MKRKIILVFEVPATIKETENDFIFEFADLENSKFFLSDSED